MPGAHINIGSNLGDRLANIRLAVAGIRRISGVCVKALSAPVESAPWGYESTNPYLNVGLLADTTLTPQQLLAGLQQVEASVDPSPHRLPDGSYADRIIDIDLIAIDDIVVDDPPALQLPHPRMHLREFVLIPMAETAPCWRHPLTGLTARGMLCRLRSRPDQSTHQTETPHN